MDTTIGQSRAHDSLELFLASREAQGLQDVSLRNYRKACEAFLAQPFADFPITEDHLILWVATLKRRGLRPATIQWYQRHLNAWIGFLVKRGMDDPRIPLVKVPRERKPTVSEQDFVKILTVAMEKHENRARDVALLRVFYSTGIRRTELSKVLLSDVDVKARTIRVRETKNQYERKIPFDAVTAVALLEYMEERGDEPGSLFLGRAGRMSSDAMRQVLQRISEKAGVTAGSHAYRRSFAARARRAGLDIGHTARILGHRDLQMVQRYSQEGEDDASIAAYRERMG